MTADGVGGLTHFLARAARRLKVEVHALWLVFRHAETPWYAKAVLVVMLLYLTSPVDLVPDVIPVLGMLDDLAVLALALWFVYRTTPAEVVASCRARAEAASQEGRFEAFLRRLTGR